MTHRRGSRSESAGPGRPGPPLSRPDRPYSQKGGIRSHERALGADRGTVAAAACAGRLRLPPRRPAAAAAAVLQSPSQAPRGDSRPSKTESHGYWQGHGSNQRPMSVVRSLQPAGPGPELEAAVPDSDTVVAAGAQPIQSSLLVRSTSDGTSRPLQRNVVTASPSAHRTSVWMARAG